MSDNKDAVWIYKITTREAWEQACTADGFAGSPDDARDGFIHLSGADQLTGTANKYFSGVPNLVLVAFCAADLSQALKWEPSRGGAFFPHYYGVLPVRAARWVRSLPLGEDGTPCLHEALQSKVDA